MPLELETFISKRGGQKRYRCPDCPYDSYLPEHVVKHWAGTHQGENVPDRSGLFDLDDERRVVDASGKIPNKRPSTTHIPDTLA